MPTPEDVSVFEGSVNLNGNTGNTQDQTDTKAHGWYFAQVGACSPDGFEFKVRRDLVD